MEYRHPRVDNKYNCFTHLFQLVGSILTVIYLVEWAIALHGMYESLLEMYYF
jgi:hypothetical protein